MYNKKKLGNRHANFDFPNSNVLAQKNEPCKLYNKFNFLTIIKDKISKFYLILFFIVLSLSQKISNVSAVEKIEGGDITIEDLGDIIKDLATKIQVFGVVAAFIALVVFVIQFIIGDDETKQRKKKTILYTLGGVVLLILVPSLINFVIDVLG